MYCSVNHQCTNRLSDDVVVEEITKQICADACVMTVDGLSPVINNYYYYYYYFLFGVFFFQLGDNASYLLDTRYSAMLYKFISLHLKQQHSVTFFLSAVTFDLLRHLTIDSSNEHVTAD